VLSFHQAFVAANPEAVQAFLAAVEQAVADVNADKPRWDDLLVERQLVPAPLVGSYTIPDFPSASVPSQEQFDDVGDWALEQGIIDSPVDYGQSVDASFLP
jgi:NitT/TauT family transport system substrate-binding protein